MKARVLKLTLSVLIMVAGVNAQTIVTGPGSINQSGDYILGSDIYGEININADFVHLYNLPGNNYKVLGNGSEVGVRANGNNITISRIVFENWGIGVAVGSHANPVTGCQIDSCVFKYNYFGTHVSYSEGNRISDCLFEFCGFQGIYLSCSNNNKLLGNRVDSTTCDGIGLIHSNYNEISNNSGAGNWVYGIRLDQNCTGNYGEANTISGEKGNSGCDEYGNLINFVTAGLKSEQDLTPSEFLLYQNYPNPFNPTTTISYQIPQAGKVKLTVFNMLGHELEVLIDKHQSIGRHQIIFDASHLPSGTYFYHLEAEKFSQVRRMVLQK